MKYQRLQQVLSQLMVFFVKAFSDKIGVPIVGEVMRSDDIIHWEEQGKTVIEGDPTSEISKCFFDLAELLWKEEEKE